MRLLEHQGKRILSKHGINVPHGRLVGEAESPILGPSGDVVLKCQVLEGGRGKAGLVRRVAAANASTTIEVLRSHMHERGYPADILIEDVTEISKEYYACVRIDDVAQCLVVMFSPEGGVEVESSTRISRLHIDPLKPISSHLFIPFLLHAGAEKRHVGPLARVLSKLCMIFVIEDAIQIEINPLALTLGNIPVALDAKIELDDSAAFRHNDRPPAVRYPSVDPLENKASKLGITFVKLPGNIALLTGGAGLGMGIVDELTTVGLSAANFIDTPAGVNIEKKIDFIVERAKEPDVDLIGVYVFQTAQPISRVVGSLLSKISESPLPKPAVVGIAAGGAGLRGMSIEDARQLLGKHGIPVVTEIHEFVEALASKLSETRSLPSARFG